MENIYYKSPGWVQNLMVSTYGGYYYFKRYRFPFKHILTSVQDSEMLDPRECRTRQRRALSNILATALKHVPYYSNSVKMKAIDEDPFEALTRFPILRKLEAKANAEALVNHSIRPYLFQTTSGTTGTPFRVPVNRETYMLAMAMVLHHEQTYGVSFKEKRATFAGRMLQLPEQMSPPFWRYNFFENQLLFSSYHISDHTLPYYIKKINDFRPKEIIGYPSSIYEISNYIKRKKIELEFRPKLIATNSETLQDWQRHTIEEVFGVRVRDYYGTAEYVIFASQCNFHNYHVSPLLGVFEIEKDSEDEFCEYGNLICTTLTNDTMPLIRYEIGDYVAVNKNECLCGRTTQSFKNIIGRADDLVITTDGKKVGRLDHVFKGILEIREAQIIQTKVDEIIVRLVPETGYSQNVADMIVNSLHFRLGHGINVKTELVETIPKSENGKFKAVVSYVN